MLARIAEVVGIAPQRLQELWDAGVRPLLPHLHAPASETRSRA